MVFELMRRDPAWKMALMLTLAALVLPLTGAFSPGLMGGMLGGLFFPVVAIARPNLRTTLFEAALPIPGRQLFLARVLTLWSIVIMPLITGTVAVLAIGKPQWLPHMAECGALFAVLFLAPLAVRVREFRCSIWLAWLVWIGGALAGTAGMLNLSPVVFLTLCALVTAGVSLKTWIEIPPAFQVAPMEATERDKWFPNWNLPSPIWWLILRCSVPLLVLAYIPFLTMQAAGGNWLMACFFAMIVVGQARTGRRWLTTVPISPNVMLLAGILPVLLPLATGAAIHMDVWPFSTITGVQRPLVREAGGDFLESRDLNKGPLNVQVPLEFWRHASGGNAPVVQAPWGEVVRPTIHGYLGAAFYNPYAVSAENSERFLAWQFGRATEAVYGSVLTPSQLKEARLRPVMTQPRMQILYVAAFLALGLATVWLLEFQAWSRLTRFSNRVRGAAFGVGLSVLLVLGLVLDFLHTGESKITVAALNAVLLRIAATGASDWLLAAGAATVVAALFWAVRKQYAVADWPAVAPPTIAQSFGWCERQ